MLHASAAVHMLVCGALLASLPDAQSGRIRAGAKLPFAPGERLEYEVALGGFGNGKATITTAGPEQVRGSEAWVIAFDLRARVAIAVVEDHTRSWVLPDRMASVRYRKSERSPLSRYEERVEIFPDERRWQRSSGETGSTSCATPLDELSFIYYLRTLPLEVGSVHSLNHHFDASRNPVLVRVTDRAQLSVPAGRFSTLVVEMQVPDGRRFGGSGLIRLFLSDDAHRIPVRIESRVPIAGLTSLSLTRWTPGVLPSR